MKYPCVCCGSMAFSKPPGSLEVCGLCGWIDDAGQLRFPLMGGGANRLNLWSSQRAFAASGKKSGDRDPLWRPLDRRRDFIEPECTDPDIDLGLTWPQAPAELYYWRETYWLRPDEHAYLTGRQCPIPRVSYGEGELREARARLFDALRALAATGDLDAARAVLSPPGGKALLYLAAFHQSDQFALDLIQRAYLCSLAYSLSNPPNAGAHVDEARFARMLAAAAVSGEP